MGQSCGLYKSEAKGEISVLKLAKLSEEFNSELARSLGKNPDLFQKMMDAYEKAQWTFVGLASKTLYIKSISADTQSYEEGIAPVKIEKAEAIAKLAQEICGNAFIDQVAHIVQENESISAGFEQLNAPTLARAFKPRG